MSNFYSFDTGPRRATGPLIMQAHHDDYGLAPWLRDDEHMSWVLRECLEEGKWGR